MSDSIGLIFRRNQDISGDTITQSLSSLNPYEGVYLVILRGLGENDEERKFLSQEVTASLTDAWITIDEDDLATITDAGKSAIQGLFDNDENIELSLIHI